GPVPGPGACARSSVGPETARTSASADANRLTWTVNPMNRLFIRADDALIVNIGRVPPLEFETCLSSHLRHLSGRTKCHVENSSEVGWIARCEQPAGAAVLHHLGHRA